MLRKLTIRGRERRFEELEGLAAVYAEDPEWGERVRSGEFGKVAELTPLFTKPDQQTALDDALAFQKAGWIFLSVDADAWPQLRKADGLFVARAFVDPVGRLMLAPGGLTVKLRPDFPAEEAKGFFENAEVEVVRRLRFGRNLYEVRAPRAVDAFDVSERLAGDQDVEYAEPKLLERIERREAGASS